MESGKEILRRGRFRYTTFAGNKTINNSHQYILSSNFAKTHSCVSAISVIIDYSGKRVNEQMYLCSKSPPDGRETPLARMDDKRYYLIIKWLVLDSQALVKYPLIKEVNLCQLSKITGYNAAGAKTRWHVKQTWISTRFKKCLMVK